ncbi:MAG TPA: secretin N-terminal domain-containing protein [Syntrophorhabdaceae bacterium]|nr:secretin N-terminal domain-containing protein [Syntrophorhabdaceae bacterium]
MAATGAVSGSISLNFDDADVFSVIQTIFGEILKVNYVVDPRVRGRVTFRSVSPVSTDQVLPIMEVILRINGIGVVEDNDLYRIVPLSDVSREPSPVSFGRDPTKIPPTGKSIIQVVPILYLQSSEVVKLITPFLSANAVVLDVPKSNQLIIVDTDASVRRILQLIDTFDNETQKKKRAQAFVYPVQNSKAADIANLLSQIFLGAARSTTSSTTTATRAGSTSTPTSGMPGTTQQPLPQSTQQPYTGTTGTGTSPMLVSELTKIFADEIKNTVIVLATPEDYETIKETIVKIDTTPRQVLIEGLIAEVTLTDDFTLGLAYAFSTTFNYEGGRIQGDLALNAANLVAPSSSSSSSTSNLPALAQGFSYVGVDARGNARGLINALATNSKSKTLAAPHILVSDNREAHIQVGSQVPIVTSSILNTTGSISTTSTVQYKDIGIILKIKPQVNESGLVAMEMSQEISALGDSVDAGNGQKEITINKTEAATNLVVHDGQTIIIGGLIREDHTKGYTGIPWFNRIPILGYLFGTTATTKIRNETVIFLTPHVIRNAEQAGSITSDFMDRITGSSNGALRKEELLNGGLQTKKGAPDSSDTAIPPREGASPTNQ